MTGAAFLLPPSDSPSDSELESSDSDTAPQTIHVGPRDGIQMSELGEVDGEEIRRRRRGVKERRVEWVGKPYVVGPEYMKMPLLTIGMLGLQCVWSIEMGYASPYLLELGLSKSLMSLVFVAGPLSGLIMQPLIGVLADRSKSRWGRRRPFMLAGCAISVFAMMLLAWAREVAGWMGGGNGVAIALAVWAIYLIDFSINAVQATDRALVVDILPPSQQEKGNAWAGRMFGTGSLAGFYVGNINLLSLFPFLGKTQLQVLSFLTSVVLMVTHGLTAYSVKERVLLRDNRKSSQGNFAATVRDIWKNIFTLPPAIRSICYAQFFAWIGWFPILFYTSVWVGEIYTREAIAGGRDPNDPDLTTDATRAGSKALFMNSVVNLSTSVFLPFLVSSSGIRAEPTPVSTRTREAEAEGLTVRASRLMQKLDKIRAIIKVPSRLRMQLPLPGFTLIRAWILGQAVFAGTMFATWFASSVWSAQAIICVNGFCWGVAQWAPFSLLGELILLDSTPANGQEALPVINMIDRSREASLALDRPSLPRITIRDQAEEEEALMASTDELDDDGNVPRPRSISPANLQKHTRTTSSSVDLTPLSQSRNRTPLGSRRGSRELSEHPKRPRSRLSHEVDRSISIDLNDGENGFAVGAEEALHASLHNLQEETNGHARARPRKNKHEGTAEKAGVILGIHNIFIVIPQFLVTFLSAIIFYIMEPTRPALPELHPTPNIPLSGNVTFTDEALDGALGGVRLVARAAVEAFRVRDGRELEAHVTSETDSVGFIFRLGGVSAAIAGFMLYRMSKRFGQDPL